MFYEPGKTEHNLPYDPFKACVIPRPIGWISTISPPDTTINGAITPHDHGNIPNQGRKPIANLAPFSQFNNLTFDPPYVMFSANQTPFNNRKDTVRNAEATGVFCWQLATWPLREAVNKSAEQLAYGVDEFERAGLEKTWSKVLRPSVPMVKDSPVRFECEYYSTLRLPGNPPMGTADIVIGRVVGVHIDERVLTNGKIDVRKTQPIARCGYYEYTVVNETFDMIIPGDPATLFGLEGSVKQHREHREAAENLGVNEDGPP
ncbi:uncharacterized protein Z518_09588 [Rhinocladiella mackenziei CBS 650.93]|uniref:Rhinocladiella mackenziei CBS 650.93 unplaced genomic scaffold supercont1.7, whole genome shotgun sequence n=1 Tax=Rhinocladiella mackenziei CBS 650.93 TaxID=1442369 RepID=A0A0D2IF24_9EURO|nr:uncharacterized protein Z518_09588 [Rhinocladiella mackenziei CBS 650.93]KIX01861.1 hypothetical protein Z518_09588 [Rhinocladiella mackenziei CBS 650.93]